jgi:hypothetical protein
MCIAAHNSIKIAIYMQYCCKHVYSSSILTTVLFSMCTAAHNSITIVCEDDRTERVFSLCAALWSLYSLRAAAMAAMVMSLTYESCLLHISHISIPFIVCCCYGHSIHCVLLLWLLWSLYSLRAAAMAAMVMPFSVCCCYGHTILHQNTVMLLVIRRE